MTLKILLIVLFSFAVRTSAQLALCVFADIPATGYNADGTIMEGANAPAPKPANPGSTVICWAGQGVIKCMTANKDTDYKFKSADTLKTSVPITPGTRLVMVCDDPERSGTIVWTTQGKVHGLSVENGGESFRTLFGDQSVTAGMLLGVCVFPDIPATANNAGSDQQANKGYVTICWAGQGVIKCMSNSESSKFDKGGDLKTSIPITPATPITMICDLKARSGTIAWTTQEKIHALSVDADGEQYSVLLSGDGSIKAAMQLGVCVFPDIPATAYNGQAGSSDQPEKKGYTTICWAGQGVIKYTIANEDNDYKFQYTSQLQTSVPITPGTPMTMFCNLKDMEGAMAWTTEGKVHAIAVSSENKEDYKVLYTGDVPVAPVASTSTSTGAPSTGAQSTGGGSTGNTNTGSTNTNTGSTGKEASTGTALAANAFLVMLSVMVSF